MDNVIYYFMGDLAENIRTIYNVYCKIKLNRETSYIVHGNLHCKPHKIYFLDCFIYHKKTIKFILVIDERDIELPNDYNLTLEKNVCKLSDLLYKELINNE